MWKQVNISPQGLIIYPDVRPDLVWKQVNISPQGLIIYPDVRPDLVWKQVNISPQGLIIYPDVREKRAQYNQCNDELMQEFSFGHSSTKEKINVIFNSHFYGSVLWNLFGNEVNTIYNTWNTSIRKMFRLDRRSHRYLIELISNLKHII